MEYLKEKWQLMKKYMKKFLKSIQLVLIWTYTSIKMVLCDPQKYLNQFVGDVRV